MPNKADEQRRGKLIKALIVLSGLLMATAFFLVIKLIGLNPSGMKESLRIGTVVPDFSFLDINRKEISLKDFRGEKVLLVFSDPDCEACKKLYPVLGEMIKATGNRPKVIIISLGTEEKNRELIYRYGRFGLSTIILKVDRKTSREIYKVSKIPYLYLLDESGKIIDRGLGVPEPVEVLKKIVKTAQKFG